MQFSQQNLTAGVAATRALLPISSPLTPLDTVVSAFSLSTPYGRTIAYTAVYEGTSFATLNSARIFTANEAGKVTDPSRLSNTNPSSHSSTGCTRRDERRQLFGYLPNSISDRSVRQAGARNLFDLLDPERVSFRIMAVRVGLETQDRTCDRRLHHKGELVGPPRVRYCESEGPWRRGGNLASPYCNWR